MWHSVISHGGMFNFSGRRAELFIFFFCHTGCHDINSSYSVVFNKHMYWYVFTLLNCKVIHLLLFFGGWDAGSYLLCPTLCIFSFKTFVCDAWASLGCWPICAPCGCTLTKLCGNWLFRGVSGCVCVWVFEEGGRFTEHDRSLSPVSVEETGMKASEISREDYVILWADFFMPNKSLVLHRTHLKAAYSGTGIVWWIH